MDLSNNNLVLSQLKLHTFWNRDGVDIREHVYGIEIFENIWNYSMTAVLVFSDTANLVEFAPIVGDDEWVSMKFSIPSNSITNREILSTTVEFDVVEIVDEKIIGHNLSSYRLKLISKNARINDNSRVRKVYEGTPSDIVERIISAQFTDGYNAELVRNEPTEYENKYIFPNLNPFSCIEWLADNSQSAANGDTNYYFYETLDGFHYITTSGMIDDEIIQPSNGDLGYKNVIIDDQTDPATNSNISQIYKKSSFNTQKNRKFGSMGVTSYSNDITLKKWREDSRIYDEVYDDFSHLMKNSLYFWSGADDAQRKNIYVYLPTQNDVGEGVYKSGVVEEQQMKQIVRGYQLHQNRHVLEMRADPAIKVGYKLFLEYMSNRDDIHTKPHEKQYGFFLVTGIRHSMTRTSWKMFVEVAKESYYRLQSSDYPNTPGPPRGRAGS